MVSMAELKLTRQMIVRTALGLLDEFGLDGLTMRRLAAELGVQNPALYWHFRNKRELLDELADAIVAGAGMGPPDQDESWQDWLARRCRAFRQSVLSYRDGARIIAEGRLGSAVVRHFEEELAGMVKRGFTPSLALRTIATLSYYTTGFVLREQTARQQEANPPAGSAVVLADLLGGPDTVLSEAIRSGGSSLGEEAFEHGLQVILAGTDAVKALDRS
jgi:TetR/AcrR family tetracycline transcriptional repressor